MLVFWSNGQHYRRTGLDVNRKTRKRYEARARIMKALSHPTRLFIVEQLYGRERCVRELTEMVGDDVSTVSKHLAVLENAGIVANEKRGAHVFYFLRIPCVMDFFSCAEKVLKARAEDLARAAGL